METKITEFYNYLNIPVRFKDRQKEALIKLINTPPMEGLEAHDYWDHLIPPVPWVFKEVGFIPPTPLGEVFAEMAADLRVADDIKSYTPVEVFITKLKEKGLTDIDIDPEGITNWTTIVYNFWRTYQGQYPGYV